MREVQQFKFDWNLEEARHETGYRRDSEYRF